MKTIKEELNEKKISKKHLIIFLSIISTLILSQIIAQYSIKLQITNSKIIGLAEKQEVIGKKLVKLGNKFDSKNIENTTEVKNTLDLIKNKHIALKDEIFKESPSLNIKSKIKKIESFLEQLDSHVNCFMTNCSKNQLDMNSLSIVADGFVEEMGEFVSMLKELSDKQLSSLNSIELVMFAFILLLISIRYFKITLPINRYLINKVLEVEKMKDERLNELEGILVSTPLGLVIIGSSGNLIKGNPQFLKLIEADNFDEVEGKSFVDLVEVSHREEFIKFNEKICVGGRDDLVFEIIGLNGRRFWCESFAAPYLLDNGSYAQIGIVNDISEKVKAKSDFEELLKNYEIELQVSRELLILNNEILDSTPDGILLINHETRKVQKVNKKFFEMWNIPSELAESRDDEKLIGCALDQLQHPEEFISVVEELYNNPLEESFDNLSFKDDRVFERYSYPLIISEKPVGRIWLFRDVTEKRELEKMLHHSAKLASIGQLAAGVGHEINNPLAIIRLFIEKLQKQESSKDEFSKDTKLLKTLSSISIATDRIAKIVLGLRTFARTEKSSDVDQFSIRNLIFEVDSMLNELYQKDEVNLKCMIEDIQESLFFSGDRGKLQQVLINLISNAKDATEGVDNREVRVSSEIQGNIIHIKVSDNGVGIPIEIQEQIFDPFFTTKDVGKGTGLGLSLVHKFVHNDLSGKISVKSTTNEGTEFTLSIPFFVFEKKELGKVMKTTGIEKMESVKNMNISVLIAEDEEGIRFLLTDMLEGLGLIVTAVNNGFKALEAIEENPEKFDLIISDMKMPEIDGPALLNAIRKNLKIRQPKVVFTTGGINMDFEDKSSNLNHLLDGYLYKPFSEEEMVDLILKLFLKSKSA